MPRYKKTDILSETNCPCSSGKMFTACCAPILTDHSLAETPEILMRSRFTAFVLEDLPFLLQTWEMSTRPRTITFEENIIWLELLIEDTPPPGVNESGSVTFRTSFIHNDHVIEMREKSVFLRKKGLWFYVNGELTTQKKAIFLKERCPCGSGKKYKRCCKL